MDLRHLRYFAVLAEERHFGRAARRLSISQPPLSMAIRQLETELQARLFTRNSRNVELTRAGVALRREAQLLLRRLEETEVLVKAIAEGKRGQLKVGFGSSMLYRGLPQIVAEFRAGAPSTELRLNELNSVEQIASLRSGDIDFGFILGRGVPEGLSGFRYHSEPFVACLPESHGLAKERVLQLRKLAREEFVLFAKSASPDYFQSIVSACLAAGFTPDVRHEVRHWMSVVSFVANGMGVALVPRTLRTSNVAGAVFVDLARSSQPSETWCVWKPDMEERAGLATIVEIARRHAGKMAEDLRRRGRKA